MLMLLLSEGSSSLPGATYILYQDQVLQSILIFDLIA